LPRYSWSQFVVVAVLRIHTCLQLINNKSAMFRGAT